MARGRKSKGKKVEEKNPELEKEVAEAEEFLDEKRVVDGRERFWSAELSQVLLRTLAVEEAVANSPNSQTGEKWNPRYPVEAKAELERREAIQKEEEEKRKKLRRPRKPESLRPGTRRPLLKSTNTECPGKNEMVSLFDFPSESESEEESRRAVSPFEVYTPSESDDEVISNDVNDKVISMTFILKRTKIILLFEVCSLFN